MLVAKSLLQRGTVLPQIDLTPNNRNAGPIGRRKDVQADALSALPEFHTPEIQSARNPLRRNTRVLRSRNGGAIAQWFRALRFGATSDLR